MGLKEKQAIANLDFGWAEKRIKEATGKDLKIEVDSESFSSDYDAVMYAENKGATIVANGIAKLCYNDIGKEAFNEKGIYKIILKNQAAGKKSLMIEKGSLTLACAFAATSDHFGENEVKENLENQL